MRKVCGWEDTEKGQRGQFKISGQKSRLLKKGKCSLTIAATGVIKNVPWEDYAAIQKDFKLLENITDSEE